MWGETAYETMQAIVGEGFASSDAVIIATFDGYWDALSASSLAGMLDAPVLLTDSNELSSQCASEIKRLGASKAYIAGGTVAVSDNVEKQIKSMGLQTKRYAGENALRTAELIAADVDAGRQWDEAFGAKTAIVATANGYWDALASGPYAYAKQAPIFLTGLDGKLEKETIVKMAAAGYRRVVIAGGPVAVDAGTEAQLKAAGFETVWRASGEDAYDTAAKLASWAISQGMSADKCGVATIDGYWDALTGAALCGKNGSVLLLADGGASTRAEALLKANADTISYGYVFGGEAAVDAAGMKACEAASK